MKNKDTSICMIVTSHRLDTIPDAITHVLKLNQGRIRTKGTRQQVLTL